MRVEIDFNDLTLEAKKELANCLTDEFALSILAKDKDIRVRMNVASNPNVRLDTLDMLSKEEMMRIRVSKNPKIDLFISQYLMENNPSFPVKAGLAFNPSVDVSILRLLGEDTDPEILHVVAINPRTPHDVLTKIFDKDILVVNCALAENTSLSYEDFLYISNNPSPRVRAALATNPNLPRDIVAKLAEDESAPVRKAVLESGRVSKEIVYKMTKDKDPKVSALAWRMIREIFND